MDLFQVFLYGLVLMLSILFWVYLPSKNHERKKRIEQAERAKNMGSNCGAVLTHHREDDLNERVLSQTKQESESTDEPNSKNFFILNQESHSKDHGSQLINHSNSPISREDHLSGQDEHSKNRENSPKSDTNEHHFISPDDRQNRDDHHHHIISRGDHRNYVDEIIVGHDDHKHHDDAENDDDHDTISHADHLARRGDVIRSNDQSSTSVNPSTKDDQSTIPERLTKKDRLEKVINATNFMTLNIDDPPVVNEPAGSNEGAKKVILRRHDHENCWRYSFGVRPATMASLNFVPVYCSTGNTSDCANEDRLSVELLDDNRSSWKSDCSSEALSMSQLYFQMIDFPPVQRRSSVLQMVDNARNSIHSRTEKLAATLNKSTETNGETNNNINLDTQEENPKLERSAVLKFAGIVGIAGCVAKFARKTFKKTVTIKLSCIFPKKIPTFRGIIITPELNCAFEDDDVIVERKFTITMPTCYDTSQCSDLVKLLVERSDADGNWLPVLALTPSLTNSSVEYEVENFGKYRCVAPHSECTKLCKKLVVIGFLLLDLESNYFTIVLCIVDDLPHLEANMVMEMSPASVYKKILPSKRITIKYGQSLDLLVIGECDDGRPGFKLENQEIFRTVLFKKFEFFLAKSSEFVNEIKFSVRTDCHEMVVNFKCFLWNDFQPYISEGEPVFDDEGDSILADSSAGSSPTQRRSKSCVTLPQSSSKKPKRWPSKKWKEFKKNVKRKFSWN